MKITAVFSYDLMWVKLFKCLQIVQYKMVVPIEVALKNGILKPNNIILNISSEGTADIPLILLKIDNEKSSSLSDVLIPRKYIFAIEELNQQTEPLSPGDEHLFECFRGCQNGKYHLTCINYPKLQCQIEVINEELAITNERKSNTIINLSGLQAVEQRQQQNKQDFGREENTEMKRDIIEIEDKQDENQGGKKMGIQNFDVLLSSQRYIEQTIENRYLRYFQEEFKIWRNFFEERASNNNINQDISTPIKEKPKSEHRRNSDSIQQSQFDSWPKQENHSPNIKLVHSCGSPQNNQNLSEFEKEQSQLTNLRSQQDNCRVDEQLQNESKVMKKTNSQNRLNNQDSNENSELQPTGSKSRQKIIRSNSFLEWLDAWKINQDSIHIQVRDDQYLVKQWLVFLKNKYHVIKFMCE